MFRTEFWYIMQESLRRPQQGSDEEFLLRCLGATIAIAPQCENNKKNTNSQTQTPTKHTNTHMAQKHPTANEGGDYAFAIIPTFLGLGARLFLV